MTVQHSPDESVHSSLFRFGRPIHEGEQHMVWLRIGTRDIFE